jgi:type I restriction enzyme S subunit
MKMIKLQDLAQIEISNVDKKSIEGETSVKLCNFVDVYYNWAITAEMTSQLMDATAKENQIAKFTLRKGQVAITKDSETRDDIGVATYIADDMPGVILGYHCVLITPNENLINGKYLNVIFHSPYAQKYFEANASGSGQRYTLTNEIVGEFPIPVIEIEKQKQIGDLFSNIDRKIANNRVICADLESMAKLLYDYWFVQFDFPDKNGKPYKSSGGKMVWNEELKREIPEGWKITTIGNITICHDSERIPVAGKDRESMKGNIPYYGATGIMGYVNRAIFNGDYVLMAEDGSVMDSEGHPVVQRVSGACWINNHAHVLESTNGYSCKLLMMILKDIPVMKIKTGSIQMKINQENMNSYRIIDIPDCLKQTICEKLDVFDEQLLHLHNENKQLVSVRDFLLPMLMNGQVKVGGKE